MRYDFAWVVPPIEVWRVGVDAENSTGRAVWDAGRVIHLQRWRRVINRPVRCHRERMIGDGIAGNGVGVVEAAKNVGTDG